MTVPVLVINVVYCCLNCMRWSWWWSTGLTGFHVTGDFLLLTPAVNDRHRFVNSANMCNMSSTRKLSHYICDCWYHCKSKNKWFHNL